MNSKFSILKFYKAYISRKRTNHISREFSPQRSRLTFLALHWATTSCPRTPAKKSGLCAMPSPTDWQPSMTPLSWSRRSATSLWIQMNPKTGPLPSFVSIDITVHSASAVKMGSAFSLHPTRVEAEEIRWWQKRGGRGWDGKNHQSHFSNKTFKGSENNA